MLNDQTRENTSGGEKMRRVMGTMTRRRRIYFTAPQMPENWDRWRRGEGGRELDETRVGRDFEALLRDYTHKFT